jgi:isocitrate dehydrogenase
MLVIEHFNQRKNLMTQQPQNNAKIAVAHGDGIGPEIMDATLRILEAAGAKLDISTVEIGQKVYERGHSAGIEDATWSIWKTARRF